MKNKPKPVTYVEDAGMAIGIEVETCKTWLLPQCPTCKSCPTYNEPECPFCGQLLEYSAEGEESK